MEIGSALMPLRPTFEYNGEDSNIAALAYSSTEMWITVRKSF